MPHRLLSQLVHVELLTPTLPESVEFAVDVLGTGRCRGLG